MVPCRAAAPRTGLYNRMIRKPRTFHPRFEALLTFAILLASLLLVHREMIFSGFGFTEGADGDSNLVNYILEHDYRWLTGQKLHHNLWSPPFFYPYPGVAAYSTVLLGALPLYAPWRLAGFEADTAFQLWTVSVSALNYLAGFLLLRRLLGRSFVASTAGAFLFAWGTPRMAQIGHQQLLPEFFTVSCVAGLYLLLTRPAGGRASRRTYAGLVLLALGTVGQIYIDFHYFWFFIYCSTGVLVWALFHKQRRIALIERLREQWRPIILTAAITALLLAPIAILYLHALREVGPRSYAEVMKFLPNTKAWLFQGPGAWLYGPLQNHLTVMQRPGWMEMHMGIGLFSSALVLFGFFRFRRNPLIEMLLVACFLVFATTLLCPGNFSLWVFVFRFFPGANAIRAVGRFGEFLLLPEAIAVAFTLDWLCTRISPGWVVICAIFACLEQMAPLPHFIVPKLVFRQALQSTLVATLRPECQTFLFSWRADGTTPEIMHIIGMWGELKTSLPTLNGYSGSSPPHYPLGNPSIDDRVHRLHVYFGIDQWMNRFPGRIGNVCWVTPSQPKADLIQRTDFQGQHLWINRLFLELLGRLPSEADEPLVRVFVNKSDGPEGLVEELIRQREFQNAERFAAAAYLAIGGADPGYDRWLKDSDALAFGRVSQAQLMTRLLNSADAGTKAAGLVGQIASPAFEEKWGDHLKVLLSHYCLLGRSPGTDPMPIHSILQSTEYQQRFQ
jgi:hypothetical protein